MASNSHYERRKENNKIGIKDRRFLQRRTQQKFIPIERRRFEWQVRRWPREPLAIPVHLHLYDREVLGKTCDIGTRGLRIMSETALSPGTLLMLEYCFEKDICYLNLSGKIVFCRPMKQESPFYNGIGIQLCNLREMDEKLLEVSVQGLKHSDQIEEGSLINVNILNP